VHTITTSAAPRPNGHYAQAVEHGGLLFVSTQLPIDPNDGRMIGGPIEQQAAQVLRNLEAIVVAGGGSLTTILRVTIYLASIDEWSTVNRVYEAHFGNACPARGVIPTGLLHGGAAIAADCIAATGGSGG
jgi:reactive intermediate/imine deaminase